MLPTFIDFSSDPPRLENVELVTDNAVFSNDHVILGNDECLDIEFEVSEDDLEQTVVSFVGLVSRLNPDEGYAPVTLSINEQEFVSDYTVPGGGDIPQKCPFQISAELLHPGTNTFTLQIASDARSYFWLYRFAVDRVNDPDNSEQARLTMAASVALFTYRVEHAEDNMSQWYSGTNLVLFIDSGETALPSMLSWRDRRGNMASISFQSSMSGFIGYYQRPNAGPLAYRGRILSRKSVPNLASTNLDMSGIRSVATSADSAFVYHTAHSWGEDNIWHKANPLAFYLDSDEDALPVNLTWRDQKQNAGSIGFVDDMSSFYGYYQRVGEGPIHYRGELLSQYTPGPATTSYLRVLAPFRSADRWFDKEDFNDTQLMRNTHQIVSAFRVQAGDIVDGIQALYGELPIPLAPPHGTIHADYHKVMLEPGDTWSEISGFYGDWFQGLYVLQLTFRTYQGRVYGPFGSMNYAENIQPFRHVIQPDEDIVAISGVVSSGDNGRNLHLGALGLVLHRRDDLSQWR
jgi:hypothetical protein